MLANNLLINFLYFTFQYMISGSIIAKINVSKFTEKIILKFTIILALFSFTIQNIFFNTLGTPIFTSTINTLLVLLGARFIFKLNIVDSLISSLVCSIFNFEVSTISMLIKFPQFHESYLIMQLLLSSIIFVIFYKILCLQILQDFIIKFKAFSNNSNETGILILLLIMSVSPNRFANTGFILLLIQSIILLNGFFIIYKNMYINETMLKLNILALQACSMQNLVDKVRTFKHDYNNTLCALGGYIALNDMKGLKNFYSRLNADIRSANNIQLININNINEPSIYNILSTKHKLILQNNINFDFYSSINFKDLSIPAYELSKILGILLDNAIEAALLSREKEISLTFKINKKDGYEIILKNSYMNKNVNIQEIYRKGISSKEMKSGIGLWEVSKILNDFPNVSLQTQKNEDYFIQNIKIPAKKVSIA